MPTPRPFHARATAWNALVGGASSITEADVLLTHGAGGVAIFAMQIARLLGARFIATTSSPAKRSRLDELGAELVLDYEESTWPEQVRDATDGRGVDFVVETSGEHTFAGSLEACAVGASVTTVRPFLGNAPVNVNVGEIHARGLTVRGIYVGPSRMLHDVLEKFALSGAWPIIDRIFAFDDAPDAFDYLRATAHFGKVVIER